LKYPTGRSAEIIQENSLSKDSRPNPDDTHQLFQQERRRFTRVAALFPCTLQSPHPSFSPLRFVHSVLVIVAAGCGDTLALSLQRVACIGHPVLYEGAWVWSH